MKPDFSFLYSELDLPPDCSLEQFKCAYVRRIGELHPDRSGVDPSSPEVQDLLPELISMYVAVNRFHRRYGRMPGGWPIQNRSIGGGAYSVSQPAPRSSHAVPAMDDADRSTRSTWRLVMLFLALFALLASWDWLVSRAA